MGRVNNHPVLGPAKTGKEFTIYFNDQQVTAYEGDTVASALMASGIRTLRHHEVSGSPRGVYCNIGHCFECRVNADGQTVRACLAPAADGMEISSIVLESFGGAGK